MMIKGPMAIKQLISKLIFRMIMRIRKCIGDVDASKL